MLILSKNTNSQQPLLHQILLILKYLIFLMKGYNLIPQCYSSWLVELIIVYYLFINLLIHFKYLIFYIIFKTKHKILQHSMHFLQFLSPCMFPSNCLWLNLHDLFTLISYENIEWNSQENLKNLTTL